MAVPTELLQVPGVVKRVFRLFRGHFTPAAKEGELPLDVADGDMAQKAPLMAGIEWARNNRAKKHQAALAKAAKGTKRVTSFFSKASSTPSQPTVQTVFERERVPELPLRSNGNYSAFQEGTDDAMLEDHVEVAPSIPWTSDRVHRGDLPFAAFSTDANVESWIRILGSDRAVVAILGWTAPEVEEMYLKYGVPLEISRKEWIWAFGSIKLDVPFDAAPYVFRFPGGASTFYAQCTLDVEVHNTVKCAALLAMYLHVQCALCMCDWRVWSR